MLALKKIALTGRTSSGKSTVAGLLEDRGAYVLDTDKIVHQLLDLPPIQQQIVQLFGTEVLDQGKINRKKIAEIVFKDQKKLVFLEKILHPLVREEVIEKYEIASKEKNWTLFVVEVPLLFETKTQKEYDATLLVTADHEVCKERFSKKHPFANSDFDLRSKRQLSQEEKIKMSDFVIENNGNIKELKQSFDQIYSKLIQ